MKKLLLLSLASVGMLLGGCASTTAYHRPPVHNRVIIVYEEPAYYSTYTSWRLGYDWGFGPRYIGHGHGYWRGRK